MTIAVNVYRTLDSSRHEIEGDSQSSNQRKAIKAFASIQGTVPFDFALVPPDFKAFFSI